MLEEVILFIMTFSAFLDIVCKYSQRETVADRKNNRGKPNAHIPYMSLTLKNFSSFGIRSKVHVQTRLLHKNSAPYEPLLFFLKLLHKFLRLSIIIYS